MDKNKLFLGFMTAALGLFLLISPNTFISFFVILLGVAAIIDGVFILAATRDLIVDPQYKKIVTVRGALSIVVGVLAVALPKIVASIAWGAMAYILAVYLIISAVLQIYTITKLHRNGIMIRQSMIEVFTSITLAVVLFIIPSETIGIFIIRVLGMVLLIGGIAMFVIQWKTRPEVIVPNSVETIEDESEVVATEQSESEETNGEE
ncbi:MAG: DUF308 domain-containing protein [Treponema sp.]|nr:DUF308 domain-containing protein [Treponema sp.]